MNDGEVAALLAGGPFASTSALLIASGSPLRAVFATPAILEMFGAKDLRALEEVVFRSESQGAQRFRQLAQSLPIDAPARLERLRFFRAGHVLPLGLICARVASAGGGEFLVAGCPERSTEAPEAPSAYAPEPPGSPAPVPLDGPLRFLWSLDAIDRFGPTDSALSARIGPNAPRPGETAAALLARLRVDPLNGFAQAIAARRTFSALRFEWPDSSAARARVVQISGAAVFDRDRNFGGFRGFGVFTGEDVPFAAATAERPAESVMEPPQAEPPPRGGAEIVVLRPGAAIPQASPNVVPFRPNAFSLAAATPEDAEPHDPSDSVELTSEERDAFREIARALGVRPRGSRPPEVPDEPAPLALGEADAGERAPPDAVPEPVAPADSNASVLLDLLPIGALVMRGGQAVYANRTMLDLVGFESVGELSGAGGVERLFAGADPVARLAGGESGLALTTRDGQAMPVDAQARAISWDGAPATLISVRRSLAAEHEAQVQTLEREAAASSASARDFESALEAAADGFLRLDATGRILAMNSRAEALFGYEAKLALGESFLILLSPAAQGEAAAALDRVARAQMSDAALPSQEVVARDREGRTFPVRLVVGAFAMPVWKT